MLGEGLQQQFAYLQDVCFRGQGKGDSDHPSALPMVTLRTFCVMNCEFGTITVERSPIWISVARTLIRRISPSTPPGLPSRRL